GRGGGGVQDRVAQPPVVRGALPGGGDRGRGDHPRHPGHGGAAGGQPELAAVRRPGRAPAAAAAGGGGGRDRALRQLRRGGRRRGGGGVRSLLCRQPAGQRPHRRVHAGGAAPQRPGRAAGRPGRADGGQGGPGRARAGPAARITRFGRGRDQLRGGRGRGQGRDGHGGRPGRGAAARAVDGGLGG